MKAAVTLHIPDGFLDPTIATSTYIVFLAYGGYVLKNVRKTLTPERALLISMFAAGIFAAQMLNWPMPGGTSLHFVGGALAGILLGYLMGFLALFLVLFIQCLVFHDGGITTFGANVLNMAIIGVLLGYAIYRGLVKKFGSNDRVRALAAFLSGWISLASAGTACGLELGLSYTFPYGVSVALPIMGLWHLALGIVEGVITSLVVLYIARKAPQLILSEV